MSISSTTNIPSGTIKPYIDTLERTPSRSVKIEQKRRQSTTRKYWPSGPFRMEDKDIAALYGDERYDDHEEGEAAIIEEAEQDAVSMVMECAAVAGIEIAAGSRSGLWSVGPHNDVPLPRLVKIVNDLLHRRGLSPLPDPDSNSGTNASSSRMLNDFSVLGISV